MNLRTFQGLVLVMVLTIGATACFKKVVSVKYEKDGLSFAHGSDWEVKEDKLVADGKARIVTIEGPENGVMTISRIAGDNPITIEEYANIIDKERDNALKEQLGGVLPLSSGKPKVESAVMMIGGETTTGLSESFDVKLLGAEVPHIAKLFMIERGAYKWIFMAQAPREDWTKVEPGFQKIFDSIGMKD